MYWELIWAPLEEQYELLSMEPSFWPLPLSLFVSSISFLIGSHVAQALLTFLFSCFNLWNVVMDMCLHVHFIPYSASNPGWDSWIIGKYSTNWDTSLALPCQGLILFVCFWFFHWELFRFMCSLAYSYHEGTLKLFSYFTVLNNAALVHLLVHIIVFWTFAVGCHL